MENISFSNSKGKDSKWSRSTGGVPMQDGLSGTLVPGNCILWISSAMGSAHCLVLFQQQIQPCIPHGKPCSPADPAFLSPMEIRTPQWIQPVIPHGKSHTEDLFLSIHSFIHPSIHPSIPHGKSHSPAAPWEYFGLVGLSQPPKPSHPSPSHGVLPQSNIPWFIFRRKARKAAKFHPRFLGCSRSCGGWNGRAQARGSHVPTWIPCSHADPVFPRGSRVPTLCVAPSAGNGGS